MKVKYVFYAALAIVVVGMVFLVEFLPNGLNEIGENKIAKSDMVTAEAKEPKKLFGIVVDSLNVVQDKIKRNQNLADILVKYNVDFVKINELAKKSKSVFDVRKLNYGRKYTILAKQDGLNTATHFIYEPNPFEYVVYQLKDSVKAFKQEKPIEYRERELVAKINSSMYEAILEQEASPLLVNRLVDVFAWQIDFFRIQKGDSFKVIYEEQVVDGEVVGIGKIKGAYFEHFGNAYYAIYYNQGSGVDYFDEDGNSLRKTFLRAPLNYTRISSRYSLRRFHPVQKRYKAHLGTDYAAPRGTPIRTVGDGIITEARYKRNNGNYVKVKHNANYTTQYLHMNKIAKGIKPGVKVKQGQTIGYVGSTGLATGPHLCFRFWKNGRQVDALKVELPPSQPIKEEHREAYEEVKVEIMARLDAINLVNDSFVASAD